MAVQTKAIPALYVVYVLRSTVRHASLYIGSTPNPPRRLKQHNGTAKGGAARTAKTRLRPWEMVAIVSGFPSMVGALKFEWALTNSHLSLHIAPEERITVSTQRKRSGMPKRPPLKMSAILSNVHLLLGVPSFSHWPLKLHFFDREVYSQWDKYCSSADVGPLSRSLEIVTDFRSPAAALAGTTTQTAFLEDGFSSGEEECSDTSDKEEKGQDITTFEREGDCVVCHQQLDHDKGLHAICSQAGCEGVGHLDCWSRHLLSQQVQEEDSSSVILPMDGQCPQCHGLVKWSDMMKELTLRTREPMELDKLVKRRKKAALAKAKKESTKTAAVGKRKNKEKVAVYYQVQMIASREQRGPRPVQLAWVQYDFL
ncbi:hypothetical protein BD289DRAFT_456843 [Coniella lustricola]|uniref:GIY-YIG domain-containing protein n=1 Tax=Coniella lustricola TaxID=2025994 RepID=A0A2T2ZUA9_9PEZI|nr:hypothetical protein BD289DRAFT_456843 [Coniella lustricola]